MYVPVLASHFILIIAFFILRWLNNYKDNLAVEAQFILYEATRDIPEKEYENDEEVQDIIN